MQDTLMKFRALVGPGYLRRGLAILALALLVSAIEAVSMLLVFVLLGLLTEETGAASLPVVGDIRTMLPDWGHNDLLLAAGIATASFFILRSLVIVLQSYVQYRIVENVGARISIQLMGGYLAMPAAFHLQRNSSELVRNAFDSAQRLVREGLVPLVSITGKLFMVAGVVTVLLVTSPVATFAAVGTLGPLTWLILRVVQPRVKQLGTTAHLTSRKNLQTLQQSLEGWRDIRILRRERNFISQYARDCFTMSRARYLRRVAGQVPRLGIETGVVLFIAGFVAVVVVADGGTAGTIPVLGLFGYAAIRLMPELNLITGGLNQLKFVGPALDSLYEDLSAFAEEGMSFDDPPEPLPLRRSLVLEGVRYRYPSVSVDALVDVDLEIRAGQAVGIVGPTGGGKTTLVDIILGLLDPTEGRVLVDGVDIRDHVRAWHANIGMVPQMVFLADDTVRRNIALGVPDDEIDGDAVLEAIRLAQVEEFVSALPDGLDTFIGERGVRVSGGQRQRLAIARALYPRPLVLVFDEGTSALDNETEAALLDALERLRGERTLITVAHRLSTVAGADLVVLVRDGRIVDRGTFAELARRHASLRPMPMSGDFDAAAAQ